MAGKARGLMGATVPAKVPEFGTSTIEEEFKALYEMDSYHHLEDGITYPAVLLTHNMNDPRVAPWQSAKMAARLQAATSGGKPGLSIPASFSPRPKTVCVTAASEPPRKLRTPPTQLPYVAPDHVPVPIHVGAMCVPSE